MAFAEWVKSVAIAITATFDLMTCGILSAGNMKACFLADGAKPAVSSVLFSNPR